MSTLHLRHLGVSALFLGTLGLLATLPAQAVRFPDGRVAFDRPPDLIGASTRNLSPNTGGRYHFTISVPSDAGEPLKALVITPRDQAEHIRFDLDESTASLGSAYARGPELTLSSIGGSPENPDEVTVVFDQPVQPGNTVTVVLESQRNPFRGGVYQFGVTAYPEGEESIGQFIGYGRIHFFGHN